MAIPDGLGVDYADLPQLHKLEHTLDGAMGAWGSKRRLALYDTEIAPFYERAAQDPAPDGADSAELAAYRARYRADLASHAGDPTHLEP